MILKRLNETVKYMKTHVISPHDKIIYICVICVLIATFAFTAINDEWMDVNNYWKNINNLYENGLIPYKDYVFEYPPFSLVIFLIPRVLSWNLDSFHIMFALFAMIAYLVICWAVLNLTKVNKNAYLFAAILLIIIPIFSIKFILTRNDIFAVLSVILSIWLYKNNHNKWAYVILAIGGMIKMYPLLLLIPFIINDVSRRDIKSIVSCLLIISLTCLIIELPFLIIDSNSAFDYLTYHNDRLIQIESVVASVMYFAYLLGYTDLHYIESYGSDNMWGELPDIIAPLMNDVLMCSIIVTCLFLLTLAIINKGWDDDKKVKMLVLMSSCIILVFIIFSKVYSAQYMLWILCLTPLIIWSIQNERKQMVGLIIMMIFGLSSLIASLFYSSKEIYLWFIVLEAIKNLMTIIILAFIVNVMITEARSVNVKR